MKNVGVLTFAPGRLQIHRFQKHTPKGSKAIRVTAEEALNTPGRFAAAMAGPMFNHTGSGKCGKGGLTPCTRLFDVSTGVNYPSCRPRSGITFSVLPTGVYQGLSHQVFVALKDAIPDGCTLGVQLYPLLTWADVNKASRQKLSSVAGLGFNPVTQTFTYIVASGGTLRDLADAFLAHGCSYSGYTDAGSSAALYVKDEGWRGVHAKGATGPKLPTWLLVAQ